MPPRRVLLADDDWIIRHAVRAQLDAQPELTVIAEAADGPQAVAQAARHQPDVVVLDHDMPTLTGLQALPALRAQLPHAVIVMCSANADRIGEDARHQGADAVVDKSRIDALIAAVRGGFDRLQRTSENLTASAESWEGTDPSNRLPAELRAELDQLTAIANAIEPTVADLAERYHRLGRWNHAWPADPTDRAMLDTGVLAASGDDRLRAVLTSIAARADAALEGALTPPVELGRHGLTGFGLD